MAASTAPFPLPIEPVATLRVLRIAHIAVFRHISQAQTAWDEIAGTAAHSAFQTRAWLSCWLETLSAALEPCFVVARDHDGTVIAFLPLGISRRAGLRTASFLGGVDAGFALGLFHPAAVFDDASMRELLHGAAREARIDLFVLQNQPHHWDGHPNPLATLPHQPSPSHNHTAQLAAPAAKFLADALSKKTRKRLRWKETRLATLGPIVHETARNEDASSAILDAYLAQKRERFRRLKIRDGRSEDGQRAFLLQASRRTSAREPSVELHALRCDGRIVATFAGATHHGRFSGMVTSFDERGEAARYGPGEVLLARVIAAKCDEGFESFDLGVGDAPYKDAFCPEVVPLFDTVWGVTARGRVAALVLQRVLQAKRTIKQSPRLWAAWRRVDRLASLMRKRDGWNASNSVS